MVKAGGGSIVNVCSIAALIAVDAGHIAYGPSKAGIANLTKVVATRWGRDGIRVNNVYPGAFPAMRRPGARSGASEARDAVRDAVIRRTALGRLGEPGDIASAVLYFASDESSYVTGADLVVDGGVVIG
jgi:NAD(P)-dependent dehydrogenase (short-subunit alcohol dehydrogenase family)